MICSTRRCCVTCVAMLVPFLGFMQSVASQECAGIPLTNAQLRTCVGTCADMGWEEWCTDMNHWNVSQVTDFNSLFRGQSFNTDISGWDTSSATDMESMFAYCRPFNQDISRWDVSRVRSTARMFEAASGFNRDLPSWNLGSATSFVQMFRATPYNGDISGWNTSACQDMSSMFHSSGFNSNLTYWDTSRVTTLQAMFRYSGFNGDVSRWNTGNVVNMDSVFEGANIFNQNLLAWDVRKVTIMKDLFRHTDINYPLTTWVPNLRSGVRTSNIFAQMPKRGWFDVNECWEGPTPSVEPSDVQTYGSSDPTKGSHDCAYYARCVNGNSGFSCSCDTAIYGSCRNNYPCAANFNASSSLQIESSSGAGVGADAYFVWNDEYVGTHEHASVALRFEGLPAPHLIGRARLWLSKEPSQWPCTEHLARAFHADFRCCDGGAGVRRLEPFDPATEAAIPVEQAPDGADVSVDVTSLVRGAARSFALVISDPNNCRSTFASSLHPEEARRPRLHVEWATPSGSSCDLEASSADVDASQYFVVPPGSLDQVRAECVRRGAMLAHIESEADNQVASAGCRAPPCYVEAPAGGAFANWLPQHPQDGRTAAALWTADGMWQSVTPDQSGRLPGLCFLGALAADDDECALETHSCSEAVALDGCLSGLTHWYKMEPHDPLADSWGGSGLVQLPDTGGEGMYQFSSLDCVGEGESCLHWSPQPSPALADWEEPNNVQLQIPLAELEASGVGSGITISFWYKRWSINKFGPRQRHLACLRNASAVDGEDSSRCLWALTLSSALQTHLATQVLALEPSGYFSASEINLLDIDTWYHLALVLSRHDNTATLYIDYQQVGETLYLEWDPVVYRHPNRIEMEVIQMEGRADIKVFREALGSDQLASRYAYMTCPVTICSNTVGSFVCDCPSGYTHNATSSGEVCVDVDECALGTHSCTEPALCENNEGGHTCECPGGLARESLHSCESADSCSKGLDDCHGFATCTPGDLAAYSCECVAGWEGNGVDCRSVDVSERYMQIGPTADGWVQPCLDAQHQSSHAVTPTLATKYKIKHRFRTDLALWCSGRWLDASLVEEPGTIADRSFVTSYLAIGGGGGKNLRTVLQFDHLPAQISQAVLELTHTWRRDPDECGAFLKLKFTALDSDLQDFIDVGEAVRRMEARPEVSVVTLAPNQGRESGRVRIDIASFVQAAAPAGGRLAFSIERDPGSGVVCDDWFVSTDAGTAAAPRLHVAFRDQRPPDLDGTLVVEPSLDGAMPGWEARMEAGLHDFSGSSLDVGHGGSVSVLQFEGIPLNTSEATLVLSKHSDVTADNSTCVSEYALKVISSSANGTFDSDAEERSDWIPAPVHHVLRLAAIDVTEVVRQHAVDGSIAFLLASTSDGCASSFRSSRFFDDDRHFGRVNARLSDRPRLEIRHRQDCACSFALSTASFLTRTDGGWCECANIGFAKSAIAGIAPGTFDGLHIAHQLDLSGNNLQAVRATDWFNLTGVRELDLSDNSIAQIEQGAFSSLVALEKLWLQRNAIRVIARSAFDGLASLHALSLSQNQVEFLELGAFNGLSQVSWIDLSRNELVTLDVTVWDAMDKLEAVSVADNNDLRCIPIFPESVHWADISERRGGFRVFTTRAICVPYQCPDRPDLLLFSSAVFLQGPTKPLHRGIEQVLSAVRPDAAWELDRAHLAAGLHVARGPETRCVCDGDAFCIESSVSLAEENSPCSSDAACASQKCCDGSCAPLDALDHRGAEVLCAASRGCEVGFASTDGFRSCADVDECAQRADDCDVNAVCTNTAGSFACSCMAGRRSVGEPNGVVCGDVNECDESPDICEGNVGSWLTCENTDGSFACRKNIAWFKEVSVLLETIDDPPPRWRRKTLATSYAGLQAALHLPPYSYPEREGQLILLLVFQLILSDFFRSFYRRSDSVSIPALAGKAIELQPRGLVLDNEAEIEVPVDPEAMTAALEQGQVLAVHFFDEDNTQWRLVETLGMTPNRLALRATISKFGVYVAFAVCRSGTFSDGRSCLPCGPGTVSSDGATECYQCGAGTYAPVGSPECRPCAANSFSSMDGAERCDQCEVGTYSAAGASECSNCTAAGLDAVSCTCSEGFAWNGSNCVDVDECDGGHDACDANAVCDNTVGNFTCTCHEGFTGDGFTCIDFNECLVDTDNDCGENAICDNEPGGFSCRCAAGYSLSGSSCTDVDECDGGDACDANAVCANTVGNFTCTCHQGFTGDGFTCIDFNECLVDTDNDCGENAICDNEPGGFSCRCAPGYRGNGQTCEEVLYGGDCEEAEADICHARASCEGTNLSVPIPSGAGVVAAGVSWPVGSDGSFRCRCDGGVLGHGYGAHGCDARAFAVRVVYRSKSSLSEAEEANLLVLMGDLACSWGSIAGCDRVHYTAHGADLGVNLLFRHTAAGQSAAESAAASFNSASPGRRRSGVYPPEVEPQHGARVYSWDAGLTGAPIAVPPSGLEVRSVHFEPACAASGCWTLSVVFTTGSSDVLLETFNTFYLPYAVGSDSLSFDYDYSDNHILETLEPSNFPCSVSDYVAADGGVSSLPARATACCFGASFDHNASDLGGDGDGKGLLGHYRVTTAFAAYAEAVYPVLCPGGFDSPAIDDDSGGATTPKPEDLFPDGARAGAGIHADRFLSAGERFVGMPHSPGVVAVSALDAFIGQYQATIQLDEKELRTKAGLLRGSVGVEHTIDFFLGFANFKPAATTWILDSLATQAAIHVEQTSFFTASVQGVNDYTFLEYVNLRLVAILSEDADFSGADESADRTVRTNRTGAAHYVQVTFTLGAKYGINANEELVPLDSVRAGRGTFLDQVEAVGGLHHKCREYTVSPANTFGSAAVISRFNRTLHQGCAPAASMCTSPSSMPDSFVSFNIPLGMDFIGLGSSALDDVVFVDMVISAVDNDARTGTGSQTEVTDPNAGESPWQVKTKLTASVAVVEGGVNIFCDGVTAKTDLMDVANVDIIVGTAMNEAELSRLRILTDVASTQLSSGGEVEIESDSIEAGMLTLVLKGNASYFASGTVNNRLVSLELEDVITIHLMEEDGESADGAGSQGKQQFVKDLLAEAPDDNSDASGLDTDGYYLNGAFSFTIDRSAQRAHLEPSAPLLQQCPFNPPRPAVSGSAVLETCVTRRDVRFRDFPWRTGGVSTAMEVSHSAGQTALLSSSVEARFLTTILGDSSYSRTLASGFAGAIAARYSLNGRFRRAFWINPGYEWAPTQTGGASVFQLSQKIFLFALVTLDEQIATDAGSSIFDAAAAAEDSLGDGAVSANQPRVPAARRRMLLSVVDPATDTALSSAEIAFPVSRASMLWSALELPPERTATLRLGLQLSAAEECLGRDQLHPRLQSALHQHLQAAGTAVQSVHILSLAVDRGGAECSEGGGTARRRLRQWAAEADMEVAVVFSAAGARSLDLEALAQRPGVTHVSALTLPEHVDLPVASHWGVAPTPASMPGSSSSTVLIAGIAAASGALVLAAALFAYLRRGRAEAAIVTGEQSDAIVGQLKAEVAYATSNASSESGSQERRISRGTSDVCC